MQEVYIAEGMHSFQWVERVGVIVIEYSTMSGEAANIRYFFKS